MKTTPGLILLFQRVASLFQGRPFVRSRALAQFGQGDSPDQRFKFLGSGGLHLHGLLPFDVAGNALDVFLPHFLHVVPTISLELVYPTFLKRDNGREIIAAGYRPAPTRYDPPLRESPELPAAPPE